MPSSSMPDVNLSKRRAYGSLAILAAVAFIEMLDLRAGQLLLDPMRHDLGLSDVQMGLALGTAFGIGFGLAVIPVGLSVDRFNRTRILITGLCCWTIAVIALAFVSSYAHFVALEAALGGVTALLLPSIMSLISDFFPPERRATATALAGIGQALGGATAFFLGGYILQLIGERAMQAGFLPAMAPWRLIYLLFAILSALMIPVACLLREPPRRERATLVRAGLTRSFQHLFEFRGFLIPYWCAYICVSFALNVGTIWVAPALQRHFDTPLPTVGFTIGAATLVASLVGHIIGGPLAEASRKRTLGLLGLNAVIALLTAPFSFFALSGSFQSAVFVFGIFSCGCSLAVLITSVAQSIILPNELRGLAIGVQLLLGNVIGRAVAPAVAPVVQRMLPDGSQIGDAIALLATPALLLASALFWLARKRVPITTGHARQADLQTLAPNL